MENSKRSEDAVAVGIRYIVYVCINMILTFIVLFGTYKLCSLSYNSCYEIFGTVTPQNEPGQNKLFEVMDDDSMSDVSERLQENGLIVNKYTFMVRTKLMDPEKTVLRPGKYMLNTSMDYEEIINQLTFSD